ncbi:hypothetical protein L6452_40508 [Arctium lappa]|uniref:Uncharacterized protein n=1 Tax=Arctium lappa TaxID=4217 RepID=A0ACB8XNA7_ARCLA|nr:hypothetical protein L6452_40508 [Arctium lappa]
MHLHLHQASSTTPSSNPPINSAGEEKKNQIKERAPVTLELGEVEMLGEDYSNGKKGNGIVAIIAIPLSPLVENFTVHQELQIETRTENHLIQFRNDVRSNGNESRKSEKYLHICHVLAGSSGSLTCTAPWHHFSHLLGFNLRKCKLIDDSNFSLAQHCQVARASMVHHLEAISRFESNLLASRPYTITP